MTTNTWLLYPGACVDRALGTWAAKTSPVGDSLQPTTGFPHSTGYVTNQPDIADNDNRIAYTLADQSSFEKLWHVVNVSVPTDQRPAIIAGSNSLWCGKFDANFVQKYGYQGPTFQILYLDTGEHSAPYTLSFQGNLSSELNYDAMNVLGGGTNTGSDVDPLQNRRDLMADMIYSSGAPAVGQSGPDGNSHQLCSFTGSQQNSITTAANSDNTSILLEQGSASLQPVTSTFTITGIPALHRALYIIFTADDLFSSEDGLWPLGHGQILDNVTISDNFPSGIYTDQTEAGGLDPFSGDIITGTYGTAGFISARVPAGVGDLWTLRSGLDIPTTDACSPQKNSSSDLFFFGGDPSTHFLINQSSPSIVSCTLPVPPGTATLTALWNEYLDLPRGSGYVQFAEYRFYKNGGWSRWRDTAASNVRHSGGNQTWAVNGDYLAEAAQADSVQLRWNLECVPTTSLDQANCQANLYAALLYDDLTLEATSGTSAPLFGIFVGGVAQSTFIDGTIHGTNCSSSPCWPGIRGTDLGPPTGINDNFNSPVGDSITINCLSSLRQNGMGINWRRAYDKSLSSAGGPICSSCADGAPRHNGAFNAAFDMPRMIYRIFDPATKTWSPFDSTELFGDCQLSGSDTVIVNSEYSVNWPPQDKLENGGVNLPGGFTVNGVGSYTALRFLPRGTRIQYYFKTVDILGGMAYQFSSDFAGLEVADLPTLPGGSVKAPDIIEFDVLPGTYAPGTSGTLLAGRTNTPLLNLDGAYSSWSFQQDPVTQALRGLGVRADRYRYLQGYESGSNIGGHEVPGHRVGRRSNYFPNYLEYPLVDSLASWYRIMIQSSHLITFPVLDAQDAIVAETWMRRETGPNQGDRCLFGSGDDFFNTLLNAGTTETMSLAQNVFGVAGSTSPSLPTYPTIDDRFAAASAGPALAPALTYTYPIDGGCPGFNRFDVLSKVGSTDAQYVAFYPNASQIAGIARMTENDFVIDNDRSKSIGYGFSLQFIRQANYPSTNAGYDHSGVENRMRVLYKFLTSCRGMRTPAPGDTGKCWPCPSPGTTLGLMQANWALQGAGFMTSTYGPLYPIQDNATVTAVEEPSPELTPAVDALQQNRPNPFNPETVIPYSLGHAGKVAIRIYDVAGRCVRTLVDGAQPAGLHVVRWNGKTDSGDQAASGVYFYQIRYPNGVAQSKKLMILR